MPVTFYQYLRRQASRTDDIGRLARDVIAAKKQSHRQCAAHCRATNYAGIRAHILSEHQPDANFLDALNAAYADCREATDH